MRPTIVRPILITTISLFFVSSALAQDSNNDNSQNENIETETLEIVVTGSRLRRDSFNIATPLMVMDRDAIEDTGIASLADILIDELPMISINEGNTTTQSSVSGTGISTIELRGLGGDQVLTLIDGRRTVSNSYSSNRISLSSIPSGMVDRVEVITGGASAVYGSDAIAGVVNIITQSSKVGLSYGFNAGETTEGGGREYSLEFDYGTRFNNDRGYMYFSANYDKWYGLSFYDRDRSQRQSDQDYDSDLMCNLQATETGDQCMRDITPADWRNLSDGVYGGVFGENSRNDTQFWYDESGLRDDWRGNEEKYGINSNQFVNLSTPDEALSVAFKVDYELTDDIKSYFHVQMSQNDSINYKSPEDGNEGSDRITYDPDTGIFGEVELGYIPIDNPYVPQEMRDSGLYRDRIYWDRRFIEVGRITQITDRNTIRSWGGLQGTLFDGEWDWDLSVGYGRYRQKQTRLNEIDVWNFRDAVRAETLDDGTIQCIDADARANGCVPLNIFGIGSITPAAANYIRANLSLDAEVEQTSVLGYIAGDLFELPAGSVAAAFGFEYRRDSLDVSTSVPEGGVTFNYVPDYGGKTNVSEIFAEAAFPLASNVTADLSARVADYSMEGTDLIVSYKAGLIWEIVDGYKIRANYARAQRAPSITELRSPSRGDYDSYDDICDGVTATSTDAGHSNCRLEPGIAAEIAADPNFEFNDNNSAYSPSIGNADLFEETADTYTLGITIEPEFLQGLQVAVDYYDIKISDVIGSVANEDIIDSCYDSPLAWGVENQFCNDVKRDDEGQIIEVTQRDYNLDEVHTRGYDISAQYSFDLNDFGRLRLKADLTHVIQWDRTVALPGGLDTTSHIGDLNDGDIFENTATASLAWYKDAWRVRWSTRFRSSMIDNINRGEEWEGYMEDNAALCAASDPACILNPESLAFYNFPSYTTHSLSVSYKMNRGSGGELNLRGGIRNIFDNNGGFDENGRHYESQYGGGRGRYVYLAAGYQF